ncbi:MAG: histidine kinase [Bacteroidales bacterium]|nr:histidine kinase [Bacteroidales bacterium]
MKGWLQYTAVVWLSLVLLPAHSQLYPCRSYTVKDGLSSSIVFGMVQDTGKYIWFATDNGISRFDGKSFRNFTTKDKLSHNSVTGIFVSDDGSIFASTYGKGIDVFRNGKFSHCDPGPGAPEFLNDFVIRNDTIFSFIGNNFYIFPSCTNDSTRSQPLTMTITGSFISLFLSGTGTILLSSSTGLFSYCNGQLKDYAMPAGMTGPVYVISEDGDGNLWFGGRSEIFTADQHSGNRVIQMNLNDKQRIKCLLPASGNRLWYSVVNLGLFCHENGIIKQVGPRFGFDETEINFIKEDHEKNIWVGTYGKGIFCFNNLYITNFSTDDGFPSNYITDIVSDGTGKILVGTYRGLVVIEDGVITGPEKISSLFSDYIWELSPAGDSSTFVVTGDSSYSALVFRGSGLIPVPPTSVCRMGKSGRIRGSWYNYLIVSEPGATTDSIILLGEKKEENFVYNRINSIVFEPPDGIWAGTSKGLWLLKNGTARDFPGDTVLGSCIWEIKAGPAGNIWIAASGGIAVHSESGFKKYCETDGYDLSSCTAIEFDDTQRAWIGTPGGLYVMKDQKLRFLTRNSGLISSEITSLHFDAKSGNLFVGTVQGLSVIDLEMYDSYEYTVPRLYFMVDGFPLGPVTGKIKIPYRESHLKVSFSSVYFRNPEAVSYRYILQGKTGEWTETRSNTLDFAYLGPGNYNLMIQARGENNVWTEPIQMPFYIVPPFWKTTGFIEISFLTLLLSTLLLVWVRYRNAKKRMNEKLALTGKITELKYQAFSAAMNPHFIFNSLNSIQHFINTKDTFSANEYLAKFSRLIRMNLDGAGKGEIRLADELKKITAYLELERMRFGSRLGYEISVNDNINPDKTLIPNMIIQPFVENAIWHGILPKEKGKVGLSIEKDEDERLLIKITDDGIGFEEGKKNSKPNHVSMGMKIITERLEMIKKEPESESFVRVTDLGQSGVPGKSGTEVRITLPVYAYTVAG